MLAGIAWAEPDGALNRGLAEAQAGKCKAAVADLQIAIAHRPNEITARNAIGVCESRLGHPELATGSFQALVKLQPGAWQAWNNLGANYLATNHLSAAVKAFRKAVALDSDAASAWSNLGSALLRQGKNADAFQALDHAHRTDPNDTRLEHARIELAGVIASEAAGEIDKAQYRSAYTKLLLVRDPLDETASWNDLIGYAEFKLNKTKDAQQHFQAAIAKDPDNPAYLLDVGEFLASHQAYAEAGKFFAIGVKRMPDSRRVRFGLAISYMLEDRRPEATELLEQLRSKYPDWRPVDHALGECYEDAGNWSDLARLGEAVRAKRPASAAGWYFEGEARERLASQSGASMTGAIDLLRQAVALDGLSSRYRFELGKAYAESNHREEAVAQLRAAIRIEPNNKRAHYVLARVYQQLGKKTLAENEFAVYSRIRARGEKDAYVAMLAGNRHLRSASPPRKMQ